ATVVRTQADVSRRRVYDEDGNSHVLHLTGAEKRCNQARGVTPLAPVIDITGMWSDTNFAHIVKSQMAAAWALVRKRSRAAGVAAPSPQIGAATEEIQADG